MFNSNYTSLLEAIFDSAASARTLQEIILDFYNMTGLPTVVADSLHCITALSPDIQQEYGGSCTWSDLVEGGLLSPVQRVPAEPAPAPFGESISLGVSVAPSVLMHSSQLEGSDKLCIMCDIHHDENVLMKLAVVAPESDESSRLVEALAKGLYNAWFRLRYTTNSIIDSKSRFLLSLIKGTEGPLPYGRPEGFELQAPFVVASFPINPSSLVDMAHFSICDELSRTIGPALISALDDNEYIFLISDVRQKHIAVLEETAKRRSLILGLSREFTSLSQLQEHHLQARGAAATASKFADFTGIAKYDEMKLFLMFDAFSGTDGASSMTDIQVELLARSDEEKNTGFMRTLFCWLLCNQRAVVAANLLGIHRNTLDNRLAKVNELIDAHWGSCTYSTCMLYSLYVTLSRLGQLEYFKLPDSLPEGNLLT